MLRLNCCISTHCLLLQKSKASAPPVLSAEKNAPSAPKPLDFLVQRFAVDPETKWRRTYALGGKNELLAVVRQVTTQGLGRGYPL